MNNTIMKDLQSENVFIIMTTLTLLRYFLSDHLIPHLIPILKKLQKHNTSIIRRKAYLVQFNIHQVYHHHLPELKATIIEALSDS